MRTLTVTIKLMEYWLRSHQLIDDSPFQEALHWSLQYCAQALQGLEHSTAKFCDGSLRWRRSMQMIDEDSLRKTRDELRWTAQATYQLWTAFNVYVSL